MRNSILTFFLAIFFLQALCQLKLPPLTDTTMISLSKKELLVNQLPTKSQVVIMFRVNSSWDMRTELKVISYGIDNLWHSYNIAVRDSTKITELNLPQDSVKHIWKTVLDNDLFLIKRENKFEENCEASTFDNAYYNFTIITKDQYKAIVYYAPEFYQENCKKNIDRERVINCAKTFRNIFKNYH